jgi:Cu/Zn superoxide dismutase
VSQERTAVVTLYKGNEVVGDITFVQEQDGGTVKLSGTVSGLTPGKHGFHIHEKGDVRNNCVAAEGHFNPEKVGYLWTSQQKVDDLWTPQPLEGRPFMNTSTEGRRFMDTSTLRR